MRKTRTLLYVIAICLLLILAAVSSPFFLYSYIFIKGIDSEMLSFAPKSETFLTGQAYQLKKIEGFYGGDDSLWKVFHFSHFKLPMPIHHPQILVIPKILKGSHFKGEGVGADFANHEKESQFSFIVERPRKVSFFPKRQKLFSIPLVKKQILKIPPEKLWRDVFEKDLNLNWVQGVETIKEFASTGLFGLVYNLYIMYLREEIISTKKEVLGISFFADQQVGIVLVKDDDPRYLQEKIFLLEKGIRYSLTIRRRIGVAIADIARKRLLENVAYQETSVSSSESVYLDYKLLDYASRIDQEGMTYLYVAWSHVIEEEGFLREMIQFLERGRDNSYQLEPLYQYAYRKFGTTFSLRSDKIKETSMQKVKRKSAEEVEQELTRAREETISVSGGFKSNEEKIEYYLKKAKEKSEDGSFDEDDDTIEAY